MATGLDHFAAENNIPLYNVHMPSIRDKRSNILWLGLQCRRELYALTVHISVHSAHHVRIPRTTVSVFRPVLRLCLLSLAIKSSLSLAHTTAYWRSAVTRVCICEILRLVRECGCRVSAVRVTDDLG